MMKSTKKILSMICAMIAISTLQTTNTFAMEGSWFGVGASYENLSSGFTEDGLGLSMEGGYWYAGNLAYGGYIKGNFMGEANHNANSDLKIYDMGAFWKAGTEEGLYGKLLAGAAFVNLTGTVSNFKEGGGNSFYFGLGGGFLFPVTEALKIGPEMLYRHLTAGNGGDQISIGALVTHSF